MSKTILFVGGGLEAMHGVAQARACGYHVVVTDKNPQAPAFRLAHDTIIASTYDIEATREAAIAYHNNKRPIDGVLSIGVDVPMTVAAVTSALGLPGISPESAALSADKLAMKERFAAYGVPVPWFAPVDNGHALARFVAERPETLVIKPVDSRGSRGVQRLVPGLDPYRAFDHALSCSPSGRVMVEAYLPGPQISSESLILLGRPYTPVLSDRNYEFLDRYAPFFIENGGDLPSRIPEREIQSVHAAINRAAVSMGVSNGMLKGDIVIYRGVAHVIEVATRLSGGYLCTLEIPLASGVDFVGAVMAWALGEPVDPQRLVPKRKQYVCQRYAFLPPGRVTAVSGLEAARALPGVAEIVPYVGPGDIIRTPTDTTARAAMVVVTGETRRIAHERAQAALTALKIEIVPDTNREEPKALRA